jgi:hypothetical protein
LIFKFCNCDSDSERSQKVLFFFHYFDVQAVKTANKLAKIWVRKSCYSILETFTFLLVHLFERGMESAPFVHAIPEMVRVRIKVQRHQES